MKSRFAFLVLLLGALGEPVNANDIPNAILIQAGRVMTMDPALGDIENGEVLIHDGRIVAVGHNLDAGDAQVIDARGQIVLPGFVDSHNHLYVTLMRGQFRNQAGQFFPISTRLAAAMTPKDTYEAMHLGALELISGGITTTGDFFDNVRTPAHADAAIRALQQSGLRAILFYGGPDKTTRHPIDLDQFQSLARAQTASELVQLGLAWRLPRDRNDADNWAMRQREYDTARRLGLPIQVHVSGEPGPMLDALIARDYLYPGLTVVHATDASATQLLAVEKAGASLALTPISEHRVGYGVTPLARFAPVKRQGLGIDGNALAGSADMYATLRLAALTWSGTERNERAPDPRALLELATRGGAEALGLSSVTGTLTPGKRADLQIVAIDAINLAGYGGGDPAALLVYSARPENVRTVLVDGRVLKHQGELVGIDVPALLRKAQASASQLLQRAVD